MITPDLEQKILADYRSLLKTTKARRDDLEREIDSLQGIVDGIQARLSTIGAQTPVSTRDSSDAHEDREAPPARRVIESPTLPRSVQATHNGKPTIISLIRIAMADGGPRDVDDVMELLARENDDVEASPEMRKSISNRMWDLKNEGYLQRVDRGVYKLASPPPITTTPPPAAAPAGTQDFARANGHGPAQLSTPRTAPEGENP